MEVHHHPDVGKKTFKEYLLEGLMIFLAVTMGFFAESLREHINELHREREHMAVMVEDLRIDTARIDAGNRVGVLRLHYLEIFRRLMMAHPHTPAEIKEVYDLVDVTANSASMVFSDRAYSQLKQTGDMRLIRSRRISDGILHYENSIQLCQIQAQAVLEYTKRLLDESKQIFHPAYRLQVLQKLLPLVDTSLRFPAQTLSGPLTFVTDDPRVFESYGSDVGTYIEIVSGYVLDIQQIRIEAVRLLALLEKEYHLDFKAPVPGPKPRSPYRSGPNPPAHPGQ